MKPSAPVSELPVPKYELELNRKDDPSGGHVLVVHLPGVRSSREVDLAVDSNTVEVEVPSMYAKLVVELPPGVSDAKATARWTKGDSVLRVLLPRDPSKQRVDHA